MLMRALCTACCFLLTLFVAVSCNAPGSASHEPAAALPEQPDYSSPRATYREYLLSIRHNDVARANACWLVTNEGAAAYVDAQNRYWASACHFRMIADAKSLAEEPASKDFDKATIDKVLSCLAAAKEEVHGDSAMLDIDIGHGQNVAFAGTVAPFKRKDGRWLIDFATIAEWMVGSGDDSMRATTREEVLAPESLSWGRLSLAKHYDDLAMHIERRKSQTVEVSSAVEAREREALRSVYRGYLLSLKRNDLAAANGYWVTPSETQGEYLSRLNGFIIASHRLDLAVAARLGKTQPLLPWVDNCADRVIDRTLSLVPKSTVEVEEASADLVIHWEEQKKDVLVFMIAQPIVFRKIEGQWRIDFAGTVEKQMGPITPEQLHERRSVASDLRDIAEVLNVLTAELENASIRTRGQLEAATEKKMSEKGIINASVFHSES